MATADLHRPAEIPSGDHVEVSTTRRVLGWYCVACALAFLLSFVGADVLSLQHDLYYLIYFTIVASFLASFIAHTRFDWRAMLRHNLAWSLLVGAVLAFAFVQNVLGESSTSHPTGPYFGFELFWRGLIYGTIDAVILYAFPAAVALLLIHGDWRGIGRKAMFAALTLVLSFGITATYHLGYPQLRSSDLVEPEIGAVFGAVPTVLTANPAGAVVLHVAFHLSANVHAYRSATFLPPDLNGYAERAAGVPAFVIAVLWVGLASCLLWWQRKRLFPKRT